MVAKTKRRRTGTLKKRKKVRLAIECSPEERKYMKMLAASEEKTLNEFVLECVRMRVYKCTHSHTPNKKTIAALKEVEDKSKLIHFDSIEDFFESLNK